MRDGPSFCVCLFSVHAARARLAAIAQKRFRALENGRFAAFGGGYPRALRSRLRMTFLTELHIAQGS